MAERIAVVTESAPHLRVIENPPVSLVDFHREYDFENDRIYYSGKAMYNTEESEYESTGFGMIIATHDYYDESTPEKTNQTTIHIGYSRTDADYVSVTVQDITKLKDFYEQGETQRDVLSSPILIFSGPFADRESFDEKETGVRRSEENILVQIHSGNRQEVITAPSLWSNELTRALSQEGKDSAAEDSEEAFGYAQEKSNGDEKSSSSVPRRFPVTFTSSSQ